MTITASVYINRARDWFKLAKDYEQTDHIRLMAARNTIINLYRYNLALRDRQVDTSTDIPHLSFVLDQVGGCAVAPSDKFIKCMQECEDLEVHTTGSIVVIFSFICAEAERWLKCEWDRYVEDMYSQLSAKVPIHILDSISRKEMVRKYVTLLPESK